jgi:hypothetical protein
MNPYDLNVAVPKTCPKSFQDVLECLQGEGISVIQSMPHIGIIRVHVDDPKQLDHLRKAGVLVEEGRKDIRLAQPAKLSPGVQGLPDPTDGGEDIPFAPPAAPGLESAPQPSSRSGWKSPLSDA